MNRAILQLEHGHAKAPASPEGLGIDWIALIGDPRLDEELYQRAMEGIEQVLHTRDCCLPG